MPATYAALTAVLAEMRARLPALEPRTLLDLGAGPGTSLWAVTDAWPSLESATLIDREAPMLVLGRRLWEHSSRAGTSVAWRAADLSATRDEPHDLVVLSYVLGELPVSRVDDVIGRAFALARHACVVVEPGTPAGFETMLRARDALLRAGGHIVAPCPHEGECPWAPDPKSPPARTQAEWCHFAVRLPRSREHRRIKEADLVWEDEKFSYVIVSRHPATPAAARVLRRPLKTTGRVTLVLCRQEGRVDQVVVRRGDPAYKQARNARWGSSFGEEP